MCKKLPSGRGFCFHALSDEEEEISALQMQRLIYKGVVIGPDEFSKLKSFYRKDKVKRGL